MRLPVRTAPEHGLVLDPSAGSGTTGVTALLEDRRYLGGELLSRYQDRDARRLASPPSRLRRRPGRPRTDDELDALQATLGAADTV